MRITLSLLILGTALLKGQAVKSEYHSLIKKADSLRNAGQYKQSGLTYSEAFKMPVGKVRWSHRFNAAGSWALAGQADSAFRQLRHLVERQNFADIQALKMESDFNVLHKDPRWNPLVESVSINQKQAELKINKALQAQLDTIHEEDQKYRLELEEVEKKYGWDSKQAKEIWKIINKKDSINQLKIKAIIDKHGWLGPDVVGIKGNSTLFLVIQHSNLRTQKLYLPIMKEAVANERAAASDLALLEDRVAIGNGKHQLYGSQIGTNLKTGLPFVLPLEDPENVDKRRAEVGLEPMAQYVKYFNMTWDAEQYKKDLPKLEQELKMGK